MLIIVSLLEPIFKRAVVLVPDIPTTAVIRLAIEVVEGLLRRIVYTWRRLVLGCGVRIVGLSKLHLSCGLMRLEEYCSIERSSRKGIHLRRNFKFGPFSRMIVRGILADLGQYFRIGDNCCIKAKVTIIDWVKIVAHTVITVGSVVTESFPEYALLGGIPARLLRGLKTDGHKP